jgi:hypothetical protein
MRRALQKATAVVITTTEFYWELVVSAMRLVTDRRIPSELL